MRATGLGGIHETPPCNDLPPKRARSSFKFPKSTQSADWRPLVRHTLYMQSAQCTPTFPLHSTLISGKPILKLNSKSAQLPLRSASVGSVPMSSRYLLVTTSSELQILNSQWQPQLKGGDLDSFRFQIDSADFAVADSTQRPCMKHHSY